MGKRHTILDAKIGSNYLQAKKLSIQNSQAMLGLEFISPTARKKLPLNVNAFTLGQTAYNSKLKKSNQTTLEDRVSSKKKTNLSILSQAEKTPDLNPSFSKKIEEHLSQKSGSEEEIESSDESDLSEVLLIKEEEIEEGVLSPREVKVHPKIRMKLYEYKKSAGD